MPAFQAYHHCRSMGLSLMCGVSIRLWYVPLFVACYPQRQNVTTSMVGCRNGHICKNLTQSGEPQRYSWGTQKQKKKKELTALGFLLVLQHPPLFHLLMVSVIVNKCICTNSCNIVCFRIDQSLEFIRETRIQK